jgi:hypothetical protein
MNVGEEIKALLELIQTLKELISQFTKPLLYK